ncbi:FecR domain-containing protein [Myxococcaceae bacterium GXIMD 01537]
MAEHPEHDPERLDLSAFEVPPPPPGLADRVMARLPEARPREPRLRWAVAAGVLLAVLGAGWGAVHAYGRESAGERDFAQREAVRLGDSVAVAEPGSQLRWVAGRRGTVRVRQPRGHVFYRVEPGSDFQVETPAGQVAVRGTCFTIEVSPMPLSKQSLSGAAVGAALTAAVFVTVHEGRVTVTSPAGATEVAAGERAEVGAAAAPRLVPASAPLPTQASVSPSAEASAAQPAWQARESAYVAELTALRARVKELEPYAPGGARAGRDALDLRREVSWLEPSKEELVEMARNCQLRWDAPGLNPRKSSRPAEEAMKKLKLSEEEADVLAEVNEAFTVTAMERLRAIYVAATGDVDNARVLAPEALRQEIQDKSSEDALARAFQRVAQERAGLAKPPADLGGVTPAEQLVRFNTGLGDTYERALAEKFGAARARELRQLNGGWDHRNSASMSCPKP